MVVRDRASAEPPVRTPTRERTQPGRAAPREEYVRAVVLAYSGELGAAWAYIGHRKSLPPGPERQAIWQILKDEVRHRKVLLALMRRYGEEPDARAEAKLRGVGRFIAFICHVGGWFVPMLGAARLEASNIVEYEILARLAWWAGEPDDVPTHLHLGEVEWDHESSPMAARYRRPDDPRRGEGDLILAAIASDSG